MSEQTTRPQAQTNQKIDPSSVAHHLRVAADKYHENARLLLEQMNAAIGALPSEQKPAFRAMRESLAKQFDQQASDALAWAQIFEAAGEVEFVPADLPHKDDRQLARERLVAGPVARSAEPRKFSPDAGHNQLNTDLAAVDGNAHPISEVIASGTEVRHG